MDESRVDSEYGKAKLMGLDIDFSKVLGDVVVENFMKSISEEEMQKIVDYMVQDLFEEVRDWNTEGKDGKPLYTKRVKESWNTDNGWNRQQHESVGDHIKKMFNERVSKELQKKIDEIITSTDYQEKIEKMAQDIVDYSVEGYKEDLKDSIRQKMIGNVMHNEQYYGGQELINIIHQVVQQYIPRNY